MHENIKILNDHVTQRGWEGKFVVDSLVGLDAEALYRLSLMPEQVGLRYALRQLDPFIVREREPGETNLFRDLHNSDGELDLFDAGQAQRSGTMTAALLRDRAQFLAAKQTQNSNNRFWVQGETNTAYRDVSRREAPYEVDVVTGVLTTGAELAARSGRDDNSESRRVQAFMAERDHVRVEFGGAGTEHLQGGALGDRLYGGAGSDLLQGKVGGDYLEGGKGTDVYAFYAEQNILFPNTDDGDDSVLDIDGKGVIRSTYAEARLVGSTQITHTVVAGLFYREANGGETWASIDGRTRLQRIAGLDSEGRPTGRHDLRVTFNDSNGSPRPGSITIKDFRDGDLNIRLLDGGPSQPPPVDNTILGGEPVEGAAPDQWGNLESRPGTLDGEFANSLNGTDRPDRILGGGGRDVLGGRAAAATAGGAAPPGDWLEGGAGRDRITGSPADDLIEGGGNEFSVTDRGGDILEGGAGVDRIFGSERIGFEEAVRRSEDPNVVAIAFAPVDLLAGGAGNDQLLGSDGADLLLGGAGRDIAIGGVGDDTILTDAELTSAFFGWSVARRVSGNEFLVDFDRAFLFEPGLGFGQSGDVAYGGLGSDWIFSGNADDFLDGGSGADALIGGGGSDVLIGGAGDDRLAGDSGRDAVELQGDDVLDGGDGDDRLVGAGGNDILFGGNGNDILNGNKGDDVLVSEAGNDQLFGDEGHDVAFGGDGDDQLDGFDGDDQLDGGAGHDLLIGGNGRDTLKGGTGDDVLQGGAGRDTYAFNRGDGVEVIYDPDDTGSVGAPPNANNPDKSVLVLGDGIRRGDVRFGSGSLKIDFGDGDAIHLVLPAGSDDPSATAMFAHIEFADGSILTWADVLAQGFDLDGTEYIAPLFDAGGQVIDPGQSGEDILVGTDNAATRDRMRGLSGNDQLLARAGSDLLEGGAGDDILDGGAGDDTLAGGAGFDLLKGNAGNDRYTFTVGDGAEDIIDDAEGTNTLVFGPGIDVLAVDATPLYDPVRRSSPYTLSLVYGIPGQGTARVWLRGAMESGNTRVELADGRVLAHADLLARVERSVTVVGDAASNVIAGGRGADFLYGQGGDDTIDGLAGNDIILGDSGDDRIEGGLGEDTLAGGTGHDRASGGAGHDQVFGEEGNDHLEGGFGADRLYGGEGNDRLAGGPDNDLLDGGAGDDVYAFGPGDGRDVVVDSAGTTAIEFGPGLARAEARASLVNDVDGTTLLRLDFGSADTLLVRAGLTRAQGADPTRFVFADGHVDDVRSLLADALDGSIDYFAGPAAIDLAGGRHRDRIVGSVGDDRIAGNGGDDILVGLAGADDIDGGDGDDVIDGGPGDDLLAGGGGADSYRLARGMGRDRVAEVAGGVNTLALEAGIVMEDLRAARRGDDLVIDLGSSADSVTLAGHYAGTSEWRLTEAAGRTQGMAEFLRTAVAPPLAESPAEAMAAYEADVRAYLAGALLQGGYVVDSAGDYLRDATTRYGSSLEFRDTDRVRLIATTAIEAPRDDAIVLPTQSVLRVTRHETSSSTEVREVERPDTRGTTFVSYAQGGNLIAAGRVVQGPIPPSDPLPQMPLVRTDGIEIRASSASRGYGVPVYANAPAMGAAGLAAPIVGFNVFPNSAGEGFAPPTLREQRVVTLSRNERDTELRVVRTSGGAGANRITVEGGMAADGGDGNDSLTGGALQLPFGAAELAGLPGSFLYGAGGDDTLTGGNGNDVLADDRGNNFMDGGAGSDRYLIFAGPGVHTIWDRGGWIHPGAMVNQSDLDFWLAGNRDKDVVELPSGVARSDLGFGWSVENLMVSRATNRRHGTLYMNDLPLAVPTAVLTVSWGVLAGGGSVRIVMPHSDDPAGAGIEALRLADGTTLTRADILALSPFDQDPNRQANVLTGDNLDGEAGDDRLSGNGVLRGGEGSDIITGGNGRDAITGDEGADVLQGGAGDDLLGFGIREYIGTGNVYRGGAGNDTVLGSHAADVFAFERGDGADLIGDYLHDPGNSPSAQRFLPRVARQFGDVDWFGNYADATYRDSASHPAIPEAHVGIDTLRLGEGINPATVGFVRAIALDYSPYSGPPNLADAPQAHQQGTDLVLDLGAGDSVRLAGYFPPPLQWWEYGEGGAPPPAVPHPLGRIEFADGTVWDRAMIDHRAAGGAYIPVNRAPRAVGVIADQGVVGGASFELQLAGDLITDPDGDTLTWSAQRFGVQGQTVPLPAWLGFDAHTRRFTGVPANADAGYLRLVVSATDPAGLVATREFNLAVTAAAQSGGSAGDGASGSGSNAGGSSGGSSSGSSGGSSGGTSGGASGGTTEGDGSSGGTSSGNGSGSGSASSGGTGDGATGSSANVTLALGASRPSAVADAMAAPENNPLFAGEVGREAANAPAAIRSDTLDPVDRLLAVLGYLNPDGSPGRDRYALPPSEGPDFDVRRFLRAPRDAYNYGDGTRVADTDAGDAGEQVVVVARQGLSGIALTQALLEIHLANSDGAALGGMPAENHAMRGFAGLGVPGLETGAGGPLAGVDGVGLRGFGGLTEGFSRLTTG
ncbi:MAG: calcium-binding protein [Burkholderiales bacterium]